MKISQKTVEFHLDKLRRNVVNTSSSGYVDLLRWGVRAGILTCLALSCYGRPWWKHSPPPPPPPPPSSNYQTNAQAWWPSVTNATAYQLNWGIGTSLATGTNWTITGITNGSNYTVTVQSVVSNILSSLSCSVSFIAGSGITNSCSSTAPLTTILPSLNTTLQ